MIRIDQDKCTGCGGCIELCPVIAIRMIDDRVVIDKDTCTQCKICVKVCPINAPEETD